MVNERTFSSVLETQHELDREAVALPETPTRRIEVPGFSNVWLKDESVNPFSGTHKDRLAMDVLNLYRGMIESRHQTHSNEPLPQFSIISSGSAAIAIGRVFKSFGLPKLKVLTNIKTAPEILMSMESSHCEVFTVDLAAKELSQRDILALTNNAHGLELTSHKDIAIDVSSFDSLSMDVLNQSPDYVLVPFGTGTTFEKLLQNAENILTVPEHEQAYQGDLSILPECNYLGAKTNDRHSSADKLYSPFLPFSEIDEEKIEFYKTAGYCGGDTGVHDVEEKFFKQAMAIAESQGIVCEPSGIAGLALLLQMQGSISKAKKILIINTGKLKL